MSRGIHSQRSHSKSAPPPLPRRSRIRHVAKSAAGRIDFGAGCFEGIRNPAAHEEQLDISNQVMLEQLTTFSLLARWIDECTVETIHSLTTTAPSSRPNGLTGAAGDSEGEASQSEPDRS